MLEIISEGQPIAAQKQADAPTNPQAHPERYVRAYAVSGTDAEKEKGGVFVNKSELAAWQEKNRRESTSGS